MVGRNVRPHVSFAYFGDCADYPFHTVAATDGLSRARSDGASSFPRKRRARTASIDSWTNPAKESGLSWTKARSEGGATKRSVIRLVIMTRRAGRLLSEPCNMLLIQLILPLPRRGEGVIWKSRSQFKSLYNRRVKLLVVFHALDLKSFEQPLVFTGLR
jgi:hypothetical protein